VGRQGDNRRPPTRRVSASAYGGGCPVPIHERHLDIHQNQIERSVFHGYGSFHAVTRDSQGVSFPFEDSARHLLIDRIIFRD
jgi:hypothetical protein